MMSMRKWIVAGAVAVIGMGCAAPTPYVASQTGGWGYGYSDQKIETDRYRVAFAGNAVTDLKTVENYVLYRAAELTLQAGYDWFEVVDRDVEADRRLRGTAHDRFAPFGHSGFAGRYGFGVRYYHPVWGWHGRGRFDDIALREITRYEASAEIMLGMGDKPEANPKAYDAADVQRNLRSQIVPMPG